MVLQEAICNLPYLSTEAEYNNTHGRTSMYVVETEVINGEMVYEQKIGEGMGMRFLGHVGQFPSKKLMKISASSFYPTII